MKAVKERCFHVQRRLGWSQGLPRSALMQSKNPHPQRRESNKAHQIQQISDLLYYRETRRERKRDRERRSCITFGGNHSTESFFQKSVFENERKKVFNFLSSRVFCISDYLHIKWVSLVVQMVKNPVIQEIRVWPLGWEDALEEEMATHSSILAWRIPWTEEPGGLQSVGLQRVRHSCLTEHEQKTLEGGIF